MKDEFKIDKLIDDSIKSLVNDTPEQAAESIQELAKLWASSGLGKQSFFNMRSHIIKMAESKTDAAFIAEKLRVAESKLMEKRTGSIIIQ